MTPKDDRRSGTDRRKIFTLDHFFNPDNERRKKLKDRRSVFYSHHRKDRSFYLGAP